MKRQVGNAALIAFAAHLLADCDGIEARSSSSSSSGLGDSSPSSWRRTPLAFSFATLKKGKRKCSPGSNIRLTKSTDRSKAASSPRYFLDSASEADVLIYSRDRSASSFSLLKPYLEFNELDLQQLLKKERKSSSTGATVTVDLSGSSLYEELEEVEIAHFKPPPPSASSSPFYFAERKSSPPPRPKPSLPPWLSRQNPSDAPRNLRALRKDLSPHLSPKQISTVLEAVGDASRGDAEKIAGAAEFCSLLVNSLEMSDVSALVASAFHYCSLVSVREREIAADGADAAARDPDAKYLCALAGSGLESYSPHSMKIALDAARLKSVEALAQSVVPSTASPGIIGDASNLRSLLLSVNEEGDWRALAIRSGACLFRLEGLRRWREEGGEGEERRTKEESRAGHEALHIYAPLAARLGMFRLKTELEDAAFRTLYPRSHSMVSSLSDASNAGEGMKSVLADISNQMKRLVQEDLYFMEHIENVAITARLKEPYSIWRKMVKMSKKGDKNLNDISILDIPDVVALRVVFSARKLTPDESDATTRRREEALCYHVLDLCTRTWPETSRFKDYVAKPKENGYQSLHYSSQKRWRGRAWPFEVQIRSSAMHRVAEYGVAAHWSYKRSGIDHSAPSPSKRTLDRSSDSYLRSLREYQSRESSRSYVDPEADSYEPSVFIEDEIRRGRKREREERLAPYLAALSGAQTDMTRENVFVFVSVQPPGGAENASAPGTVLSLPRGSRVLDAIRAADEWSSALGRSSGAAAGRLVMRNGRRTASQTELLDNGDVVSILRVETEDGAVGVGGEGMGSIFFG